MAGCSGTWSSVPYRRMAFTDLGYFLTPLLAALLVFFLHPHVERIQTGVNVFDAVSLGLFCVAGTTKAHEYGLGLTASAALGLATAVGGGVLRDVLANEVPSLLRWDRDLYAVPAMVGAGLIVLCISQDALNPSHRHSPRSRPSCCGCWRCGTTGGRRGPGTGGPRRSRRGDERVPRPGRTAASGRGGQVSPAGVKCHRNT